MLDELPCRNSHYLLNIVNTHFSQIIKYPYRLHTWQTSTTQKLFHLNFLHCMIIIMLFHWRGVTIVTGVWYNYSLSFFIILFARFILKRVCHLWKSFNIPIIENRYKDWIKFIKRVYKVSVKFDSFWPNMQKISLVSIHFYIEWTKEKKNLNAFPKPSFIYNICV